jgi:hypothetical protein
MTLERPSLRLRLTMLVGALALVALGAVVASDSARSQPQAGASAASCNGKSFAPTQRSRLLSARGNLNCGGDVAKQRLRTCLEQRVGRRFRTVACDTSVRFGPGRINAVARRTCPDGEETDFRTRSFFFLRDEGGDAARGKAISDPRSFPRRC